MSQTLLSQPGTPADDDRLILLTRYIKTAILGILFIALFHTELRRLMDTWKIADESHGILIPAFSLYFLWQDKDTLRQLRGRFSWVNLLGIALIALGVIGYSLCLTRRFGSPRPYMMVPVIAGLVWLAGGWTTFKRVWLPICFLAFAFQLPPMVHDRISIPLRMWASDLAAIVLNAIPDISCDSSGVLITGNYRGEHFDLNVAEACSGMRLLRTFVALGVAMAWLEKRPASHRVVLLISTIPIAIFCNMLRVLITGLIHIFIGPQYAQGMLHTLLGLIMLGVAFALYGGLAWIMNNLFIEPPDSDGSRADDDGIVTLKPTETLKST